MSDQAPLTGPEPVSDAAFDARLRDRLLTGAPVAPAAPDPVFRAALRAELQQRVTTSATGDNKHGRRPGRWSRWSRRRTLTLSALVLAGLGGASAAVAGGLLPTPGADQVLLRTPASTVEHTGTATVDFGQRPEDTTSVELLLTCLTPGSLTFADGAGMNCSAEDIAASGNTQDHDGAIYSMDLKPGQTSTTITATPDTRWSLTSTYSTHTPTNWATNARGDTYGITKDDGSTPDLIAVAAHTSSGAQGYVHDHDLNPEPEFTSPQEALDWQAAQPAQRTVPVYASDGITVIGEFTIG